jgi:hypothetical protein
MGNKNQSATASWTIDDWAYGTGANAVSMEEVVQETGRIRTKYFGGQAVENDASIHQMQHDLLSFDETLKNIFRRKKNKRSKQYEPPSDEYYYEEEEEQEQQFDAIAQPTDSQEKRSYLQPIFTDGDALPSVPITDPATNTGKIIWRCSNCTVENKMTDRVCRRCGQAETRL